jgi:hypothetical protein
MKTKLIATVLAFAAWLLCLPGLVASENLRKELTGVAQNIKQLLDSQQESAIAIGQFTGPANYPSSSGPGIAQMLSEELTKLGIQVKQRAKLGIRGEYYPMEINAEAPAFGKEMAVQLKGAVEDGFGKVVADFSFKLTVKGESNFVEMMGVPVSLVKHNPEGRAKDIRNSYDNPKVYKTGTRISAGPNSPYAIEILVAKKPCDVHDNDGLAYIKLDRGDTYAVRLINDSPYEAAVRLSIDGLSMFTFSEIRQPDYLAGNAPNPKKGQPLYNVVLVPKKGKVDIVGWHRNNKVSDQFLITEYAKSAAASIYHKTGIGTITATFAAAWPTTDAPPKDEPPKSRDPNATGFGDRVQAPFVEVQRTVGAIRASVSVRYNKEEK